MFLHVQLARQYFHSYPLLLVDVVPERMMPTVQGMRNADAVNELRQLGVDTRGMLEKKEHIINIDEMGISLLKCRRTTGHAVVGTRAVAHQLSNPGVRFNLK